MADQLSQQDVLRIVRHFLLSAPPGEFEDVLSDIREIIRNDDLLNQVAFDVFHQYNIEQLIPVDVPGKEHKIVLSKYGEIDATHYLDPISNTVVTVDHTKGQATDAEPSDKTPDADVSKIRNVIQTAIDKYVADYYLSGLSTVYPSENNVDYYVCISASKFNEKNFWSGRWRSVYKVTVDSNDCKKAKLSGTMRVNVHYYESGNIQMNTSKEHGEQISGAGMEDLANAISASISKAETQFHTDIDNACTNLNETFKSLRRRLPLNKQLFVFDSNAHKIQQNLKK